MALLLCVGCLNIQTERCDRVRSDISIIDEELKALLLSSKIVLIFVRRRCGTTWMTETRRERVVLRD